MKQTWKQNTTFLCKSFMKVDSFGISFIYQSPAGFGLSLQVLASESESMSESITAVSRVRVHQNEDSSPKSGLQSSSPEELEATC